MVVRVLLFKAKVRSFNIPPLSVNSISFAVVSPLSEICRVFSSDI
jgi:hypothetical protein